MSPWDWEGKSQRCGWSLEGSHLDWWELLTVMLSSKCKWPSGEGCWKWHPSSAPPLTHSDPLEILLSQLRNICESSLIFYQYKFYLFVYSTNFLVLHCKGSAQGKGRRLVWVIPPDHVPLTLIPRGYLLHLSETRGSCGRVKTQMWISPFQQNPLTSTPSCLACKNKCMWTTSVSFSTV